MTKASVLLKVVGVLSILTSAFGLIYNEVSIPTLLTNRPYDPNTPGFLPAFLIMSAVCIGFYVVLLVIGIQFVRERLGLIPLFVRLMACEIAYFILTGLLWLAPAVGSSVAAATGVANGGLMAQFIILFPLWAPFAVKWAQGRLAKL